MNIKHFFIIAFLAILSSCTNDSTSDITIPTNDSLTIKYSTDIASIINSNCLSCHTSPPTNGAPMQLTTYDDVKNAILNRGLIDRISRTQGAVGMMPNGGTRLPQATIDKIIKWQTDGFVN
ncbi:MAG: cytochrome c [Flavobacterium sp.]|uniref:cytochrome c n=1 Tax=Flavobacterium sp. TaxID=239 RepID=UPI003264826F